MFIGHFGAALAAKKLDPQINLGTLFMATQFIDLIWPVFVLMGWENVSVLPERIGISALNFESYPYSHSLVGALGWSVLLGLGFYFFGKNLRESFIVFAVALSHWVLDFIVHEKDLPLMTDHSQKVGLELWHSPILSVPLEIGLFVLGTILFLSIKSLHTNGRKISFALMSVFLLAIYLLNIFGPPPPPEASAAALAGPALSLWIFVIWAYLIDRQTNTHPGRKDR